MLQKVIFSRSLSTQLLFFIVFTLLTPRLSVLLLRLMFSSLLLMVTPYQTLKLYCTIIGNLVYLIITHPNIANVVHIVGQFVVFPTTVHWDVIFHIQWYL